MIGDSSSSKSKGDSPQMTVTTRVMSSQEENGGTVKDTLLELGQNGDTVNDTLL